ncbi:MAG: universal stress protein [Thermovirgaceae bacterium]|jgi:nucleotide-binding universal stress UspA family protein|nr:universal stress protein [Synergistales bacterium]MBP8995266.1 universal stress protein [Synergistales bacterium]HOC81695.1 universal stress protein [Synergistales bacterium]HOR54423.1 universal stress protein [Synergistales bacterium]
MMRKALVAIDGSDITKPLVRFAFERARKEKLQGLDFIYVFQPYPAALFPGMPIPTTIEEEHAKATRKALEAMVLKEREEAGAEKVEVSMVFPYGSPSGEIIRQAEEYPYRSIFIGHRGMGSLERFFIGSVAARVVEHAPCTVIVFRPRD